MTLRDICLKARPPILSQGGELCSPYQSFLLLPISKFCNTLFGRGSQDLPKVRPSPAAPRVRRFISLTIRPKSSGIINALMTTRYRFLPAAAFLYLAVANVIWIARDTRPPFWDMGVHQTTALSIYDAFASLGPRATAVIPKLSGSYPPLYHTIVAMFYA